MWFFSLLFSSFISVAPLDTLVQGTDPVDSVQNQFVAYPIVFYLPETKWGAGAAGFYNFRFRGEAATSNPSLIQFSFSYTQNKQVIVTIPMEWYLGNNLWKFDGEISYFKYQYNFYGIGDETTLENRETFRAEYPRFRMDVLRRFKRWFGGVRYRFDAMQFADFRAEGLLEKGNYTGKFGGTISGAGLVLQLDTRNRIYHPTRGVFMEWEGYVNRPGIGSDFSYSRYSADMSAYFGIDKEHVVAVQCSTATIHGEPIFYDMLYFGSPRIMRGYQDRRFIDKNMLLLQAEYRFPIFGRIQGAAFYSAGAVAGTYGMLFQKTWQQSFGGGLRIILNKKDRLRLRVDYGRTLHEGGAFYLTVNDAF
jgi:outer membrane protein assembly factor BamA